MNFINKHSIIFCSVLSLIVGALIFLVMFGYNVINPTYVDWIYAGHVDLHQAYTGWYYFRQASWNFPLGTFNELTYPNSTSLFATDSIPLFAIFLKLLSPFLPQNFQYFGIYTIICYMLQSFFGMLLARKYTERNILGDIIAILSGSIFCLVPVLILLSFWHSTLVCHWLVLACFVLIIYQSEISLRKRTLYYAIIGFISAAIHPHIMVICGIIALVHCIYLCAITKNPKNMFPIFTFSICSLIVLYFIGMFSTNQIYSNTNLFLNSFNLNGFFNSHGNMRFFNYKAFVPWQYEGYSYFGLGIIGLIFISFFRIFGNIIKRTSSVFKYKKEIFASTILIAISVLLALSPRITFSDNILYEFSLPDFIIDFWSIFRSTGRFIWIAEYTILIFSLLYCINNFSKRKCLIILFVCIALQIFDYKPMYEDKSRMKHKIYYYNWVDSILWDKLIKDNKIKTIYWDKAIYDDFGNMYTVEIIEPIVSKAKTDNIMFNYFYLSRPIKGVDEVYFKKIKNLSDTDLVFFLKGGFDRRTIMNIDADYFYSFQPFIVARKIPIKGWEGNQLTRQDVLNRNFN